MAKQQKPASKPTPKTAVSPKVDSKGLKALEAFNQNYEKEQKKQILNSRELNDIAKELTDTWSDLSKAIQEINKRSSALGDNFDEIVDYTKTIYANMENIGSEMYDQVKVAEKRKQVEEERNKRIEDEKDLQSELEKIQKKIMSAEATGKKDRAGLLKMREDEVKLALSTQRTEITALGTKINALKTLESTADALDRAHENAKKIGIDMREISDNLSEPFEKALSFLDKVPGGGILRNFLGVDKKLEVVTKSITNSFISGMSNGQSVGVSAFKALASGASTFMATLGPILPILIAVAAALYVVKKAFDLDQEVSDLAKGMGQTKDEALEAHHHLLDVAATTKVVGANTEALVEAHKSLNAVLGTNVNVSQDMLESQILLTKQYGLTAEEAADFQVTSAGTGKTVEQNLATVEAMVKGYNTMTGDQVNFKEISKDIAKTSKATLASYKGDVKALTLAAVQAKKMGMSLEDTQGAADKLLDIESSIEAEMKANVLTGKHMNMNAARQLALQGKTAEAAAEAVSQAGSYDELMSMAPYQQQAIAEAAGLTVDQLVKAAELKKYSQALNGVEVKDMKDLTAEQIKQLQTAGAIDETKAKQMIKEQQIASAQEKMSALGDKLMTVFSKLAGPIMELLDPLMEIVDFIFPALIPLVKFTFAPLFGVIDMLGGIIKMIKGDMIGGLKQIGTGIIEFFFAPFKLVFDLITGFFPGIKTMLNDALGYITDKIKGLLPDWAISLLNLDEDKSKEASGEKEAMFTNVDDAQIDPDGGLIVSGPKGSYQLNSNDSVVAGTNLNGSKESGLGSLASAISAPFEAIGSLLGGGRSSDNKEVVALLKELIAKVDQPVKININGRVMDEIEKQTTLRKTYSTKVDGGYGTFG
jgi:hypothetical protein